VSETFADFARRARTERGWWLAAGLTVFAVIYPFIVDYLRDLPLLGASCR
jgi:hypothetical protein